MNYALFCISYVCPFMFFSTLLFQLNQVSLEQLCTIFYASVMDSSGFCSNMFSLLDVSSYKSVVLYCHQYLLVLNVGQVWVQNERPLLSLNSFHRNISSSLCSTLILFSPSSFQILEILDLIQSLIQMPFHPIKYFWLPFSR